MMSVPFSSYCAQFDDKLSPKGSYYSEANQKPLSYDPISGNYTFNYDGEENISYIINVNTWSVKSGLIQIKTVLGNQIFYPIFSAGMRFRDFEDSKEVNYEPYDFRVDKCQATLTSHGINPDGKSLMLKYQDSFNGVTRTFEITFHLEGKTLVFEIQSTGDNSKEGYNNYCGFSFDQEAQIDRNIKIIEIPYAVEWVGLYAKDVFFTTYLDRNKSSASAFGPSDGTTNIPYNYPAKMVGPVTQNNINDKDEIVPVHETGYLTVSRNVMDVLPVIGNPPSPYRDQLTNKIVLNMWDPGFFNSDEFIVVRKWLAPESGFGRIKGNAHSLNPNSVDTVILKICKFDKLLWEKPLPSIYEASIDFDLKDVKIEKGDSIYFEISRNYAYFDNAIYFSPVIELKGKTYDSYKDYAYKQEDQGKGGWYYMEKFESGGLPKYEELESDTEGHGWWYGTNRLKDGIPTTNVIGRTWAQPGRNALFTLSDKYLRMLKRYGMSNIAVIYHEWQNLGYDTGLPKHWPPNNAESLGGEDAFISLVTTARELGYLFAAHENYVITDNFYRDYIGLGDTPENKEKFRNSECWVKDANGNPVKQMWEKITIDSSYMKQFANLVINGVGDGSIGLKSSGVNAGFLDMMTGNNPEALKQINMNSKLSTGSFKEVINNAKDLFKFEQNLYQGPLFGEGGYYWGRYDTYYAGYVDGVARQIEDSFYAKLIPDFELDRVRPLMANHGMGYYNRFYPGGSDTDLFYNLDLYRVTEIAYGHAGFIDSYYQTMFLSPSEHQKSRIKEYYLLQQLQSRYLQPNADATVKYWSNRDGAFIDLDSALKIDNYDFVNVRLYITYNNGLEILINRDQNRSWHFNQGQEPVSLPPNGWYASNNKENFIAMTANAPVDSNTIIDYVNSGAYTFADNRRMNGSLEIFDITTDAMAILNHKNYGRRDVCLLGGTKIDYSKCPNGVIETEKTCYATLNYLSENVFQLMLDFQGDSCWIIYKDIPDSWLNSKGVLPLDNPEFINIKDEMWDINLVKKFVNVSSPDGKSIKFEALRPLINYRITITPQK
jgi:hypothetical protein